jgi:hypothetical protein
MDDRAKLARLVGLAATDAEKRGSPYGGVIHQAARELARIAPRLRRPAHRPPAGVVLRGLQAPAPPVDGRVRPRST